MIPLKLIGVVADVYEDINAKKHKKKVKPVL